jgi:hypothetical protein
MTFWAKRAARVGWLMLRTAFATGYAAGYVRAIFRWKVKNGRFRRGGGGTGGEFGRGGFPARCPDESCGHFQPCSGSGPDLCPCAGCRSS